MVHSKANTTHPIHWIHERKTEVEYENERQDSFLFRAVEGNVAPYYASLFFSVTHFPYFRGAKKVWLWAFFRKIGWHGKD